MASSELHSRNTAIGEGQVICPKCGEVNSSNFLFCGMCGTILEPARKAAVPHAVQTPRAAEVANSGIVAASTPAPAPPAPAVTVASEPVPAISGPSLLGLNQGNTVDDFRERSFSGLASYGQPDEPKGAGKEVLLTVVLVAALAGAGWWTYKNYIGIAGTRKPAITVPGTDAANTPSATSLPAEGSASKPPEKTADVKDEPAPAEHATENSSSPAVTKPPAENTPAPEPKKEVAEAAPEAAPKPATPAPTPARHEVSATRIPVSKPQPAATDSGDALFRRGESYLYGRNGSEDCGNALKYLKMAADQQHAKARSMMGTMYATGHCVPRDLPDSYRWFALALRVDPNNPILEKDLRAVWNQMTPPERQLATRSQ
jgi:zinc-ribbon domain/Sel1 repeat